MNGNESADTSATLGPGEGELAYWRQRCGVLLDELQRRTQESSALRGEAAKAQLVPKLQDALLDMTRQRDAVTRERDNLQLKVMQLQKDARDTEHRLQMDNFNKRLASTDLDEGAAAAFPSDRSGAGASSSSSQNVCIVQTSAGPQLVFRQSNAVSSIGFAKKVPTAPNEQIPSGPNLKRGLEDEEAEVSRVMSIARDAAVLDQRLGERDDNDDEELERRFRSLQQRKR